MLISAVRKTRAQAEKNLRVYTFWALDVNVKNQSAVVKSFFKLELKLFKGKIFIANSSLKIKCGESKGIQEKVSIMGISCG